MKRYIWLTLIVIAVITIGALLTAFFWGTHLWDSSPSQPTPSAASTTYSTTDDTSYHPFESFTLGPDTLSESANADPDTASFIHKMIMKGLDSLAKEWHLTPRQKKQFYNRMMTKEDTSATHR